MKELLKNIFYIGAGAAFMTKEKVEELKKELIEKGKMTQDEGKQFVEELIKKTDDAKDQLEMQVKKIMEEQHKKMNIASRDEVAELRAQIEELRTLLDKKSEV